MKCFNDCYIFENPGDYHMKISSDCHVFENLSDCHMKFSGDCHDFTQILAINSSNCHVFVANLMITISKILVIARSASQNCGEAVFPRLFVPGSRNQ